MAKLKFTEKLLERADDFDGMEAEYLGRVFQVKRWAGDTRSLEVRRAAYRKFLNDKATEFSKERGDPPPEKEEG